MPHRDADEFFGVIATQYKQYSPKYPEPLFRYLASLAPQKTRAWDCGTGSGGQAARGLAAHFEHVIATDASPEQIAIADPYPGSSSAASPPNEATLKTPRSTC